MKSLDPYDLGKNNLVEHTRKININDLVRFANKELKRQIVKSQVELLGLSISLITSKTHFEGERLWFSCPTCKKELELFINTTLTK